MLNRLLSRLLLLTIVLSTLTAASGCITNDDPWSGNRDNPLLVILWDPHREAGLVRPTVEQVDRMLFGAAPSLADYFASESNDQFHVEKAAIVGWYDADKPGDHYWNHPQPGQPGADEFLSGHVEKWAEAIRKANADFDFKAYDTNGDGKLSVTELAILIVIPQLSPFGSNRGVVGRELPSRESLVVDGVELGAIAEVYTGMPMNFGVAVHELGHLFHRFPDLYGNGDYRAGAYSVMDITYTDARIDPYNKLALGWLDVVELSASGSYTLESIERSHSVISISRPGKNERFIIENRQPGVYGTQEPDTGLAIWNLIDDEGGSGWVEKNIRLLRRSMLTTGTKDDKKALWHAPEASQVTLKWADGTDSGVTIRDFPVSAESMTFSIEMR